MLTLCVGMLYNLGVNLYTARMRCDMIQTIIPLRDLSNKTSQVVDQCERSGEPIFVTRNGYGALVVMSMEAYQTRMAQLDLYQHLFAAENELADGKLVPAEKVFDSINEMLENAKVQD